MEHTREYYIEKIRQIAVKLYHADNYGALNDKMATVIGYIYERPQCIAMYKNDNGSPAVPYYPPEFRAESKALETAGRYIRRAIEQLKNEQ